MCSETFLRLPEEKRTRFLDAAWEEFTRVPFSEVSINKIVLRARIPRGSFYQYFADKEDLFFYLLGGMLEYFCGEYSKILRSHGGDIFRTQTDCFDQVLSEQELDPMLTRIITLLRLNHLFLVDHLGEQPPVYTVWNTVRPEIDHRMFRDEETERQVFAMSLMVLVVSLNYAMAQPGHAEDSRRELLLRLEILKNGCLCEKPMEVHI